MPQKGQVAVIGAGPLGLAALKTFLEDGFEATGFEARPYVGGLWRDSEDSSISVQATTIFNSSKFRSAFSDFPFSEATDVYPTAAQIYDYLQEYADQFGLRKHMQLSSRVKNIVREHGRWTITIEDTTTSTTRVQSFDRVCSATGSFYTPRWPQLVGIDRFAGRVLHSIDFHSGEPFKGQNVLLIGMHATAQDAVNSLVGHAEHVYLSHRHGLNLLPRYQPNGQTTDTLMNLPFMFLQAWMESNIPSAWTWLTDTMGRKMSKKAFPNVPKEWCLDPAPSFAISTPLMADSLYPLMQSGFAEPVPSVKEITGPKTIELDNGRVLKDVDAIIYCTGYHFDIPADLIPHSEPTARRKGEDDLSYNPYPHGPGSPPRLYQNIFPLSTDEEVRNTLAFIGHGATIIPGFVQHELAASAISQVWLGRAALPPRDVMVTWYEDNLKHHIAHGKMYDAPLDSTYYTCLLPFASYIRWLDETTGTGLFTSLGGKFNGLFNLNTWRLWWQERELYDLITKGIFSPTIWRVFDLGRRKCLSREEALKRLRRDNEVFQAAVKEKKASIEQEVKKER